MNEEIKQAQETLLKLSALALKYLVNNFHYNSNEYANGKLEIGNLTDRLRFALNDFGKYQDSQQDLIKGKDEYIAKLCNDRAELKDLCKEYQNKNISLIDENTQLIGKNNSLDFENKSLKKELNELREFAKLVSEKGVDMLILRQANKHIDYASVLMPYELNRQLTQAEFDLVKKVVEKYGKN